AAAVLAVGWAAALPAQGERLATLRRAASRLSPWAAVSFSPLLLNWSLWPGRELTALLLILGAGLLMERAWAAAVAAGPVVLPLRLSATFDRALSALARQPVLPMLLVLAGALFYSVFFTLFMWHTHYRTGTSAYDLGIENNLVWNAAHLNGPIFKTSPLGGPTATHVGYHETFISYLLAPFYRLWPTPEALLCLQATLIAFATVPLHLWARAKIGAWPSVLVCFAYLLSPAVHGANLYDFHYQPLAPFFIFWVLLFMEQARWRWAILWVVLTLAVREDMSLMLAVVGGYLIFTRTQVRAGLILAGICLVIFVVQKNIIMPSFLNGFPAYINQYEGLLPEGDKGFGGVIKTVIGNPTFTLTSLLEQQKLVYGLQIFAPLVLLPLRRWVGLWLCLPGFFFTLLSTKYPPLLMISFQYTAYWSMFVFLASAYVMSQAKEPAQKRGMLAGLGLATLFSTVCFGAIWQQNTAHGAWDQARFVLNDEDKRRHDDLYEAIAHIPPDAKVAASERLNPHVSSRADAYTLRGTIFDAEYVLFETPWIGGIERDAVRPHLESKEYGVHFEKGNFWVLKRGADPARNEEVLRFLR
ncbi:MAG: DUF2079 domain-containing protein, partial [Myxococcaceae bacterium]|nr:DUF2079 domain-containing protein [Myxococcaceae bacterium]